MILLIIGVGKVFSTYVEMILLYVVNVIYHICVLHVCGDDPDSIYQCEIINKVFSTYVEMIPIFSYKLSHTTSVLHVCGDDPLF